MWAQLGQAPMQGDHRLGCLLPSSLVVGSVILSTPETFHHEVALLNVPVTLRQNLDGLWVSPQHICFALGLAGLRIHSGCFGSYLGGVKQLSMIFIHSFIRPTDMY